MELSKRQMFANVITGLKKLEYKTLPGPPEGATRLVFKTVDGLVLTLVIQTSRKHKDRFTGSFNLANSFIWGLRVSEGYPVEAYERVGSFLTDDERAKFLSDYWCRPGVVDAWWDGYTQENAESFLAVVELTESRFLAQPGLIGAVRAMEKDYRLWLRQIAQLTGELSGEPVGLRHQPKHHRKVPPAWYWATELFLRENSPEDLDETLTAWFAVDAWRMATLL